MDIGRIKTPTALVDTRPMYRKREERLAVNRKASGPRRTSEEAFTLIELMTVILIIGILVAIALPTFLGARTRAQDTAATSELRTGLAASKVYYTDGDTYSAFDPIAADKIEPSLQWLGNGDPPPPKVAIAEASGANIDLVRKSDSGTYFCVSDIAASPGGVHFGKAPSGAAYADLDTSSECFALPSP
jgi:type IV pilus assembly protein PilA